MKIRNDGTKIVAECWDPKIDAINLFHLFLLLLLFSIHKRENDIQHFRSSFEYIVYTFSSTRYTVKSSRWSLTIFSNFNTHLFFYVFCFGVHHFFPFSFILIRRWPTSTKISISIKDCEYVNAWCRLSVSKMEKSIIVVHKQKKKRFIFVKSQKLNYSRKTNMR